MKANKLRLSEQFKFSSPKSEPILKFVFISQWFIFLKHIFLVGKFIKTFKKKNPIYKLFLKI